MRKQFVTWQVCLLSISVLFAACKDNSPGSPKTGKDSLFDQTELLPETGSSSDGEGSDAQPDDNDPPVPSQGNLKTGLHALTLHWISWDHPGKANVQFGKDGWFTIKGRQDHRSNDDYLSIDGMIRVANDSDLLFRGKIEYKVESISNGIACIKEGEQVFRTKLGRQYWRLQNMASCEGGTTDYVDLYFK